MPPNGRRLPSNGRRLPLAPVILIAGPTASGKSALALELAAALGGTIINADSLQIYRDLRILSARPDAAAIARAPHRLYGYLDAAERGSAGRWRALALSEIAASHRAGRLPIVVGGSGLYLRALQHGLAAIPPVPATIREEAAALYRDLGEAGFRERLAALDPAAATRLSSGDRQRLMRAFEVVRAAGRSASGRPGRRRRCPTVSRRCCLRRRARRSTPPAIRVSLR